MSSAWILFLRPEGIIRVLRGKRDHVKLLPGEPPPRTPDNRNHTKP